jgi:uncharacterized membrane protein YhaH (DUF805 family)
MSFPAVATTGVPSEKMTFGKSIATCLTKYADFKGRASRSEFWWFELFVWLIPFGSDFIDPSGVLSVMLFFGLLLPGLAAGARRLHDTNRSGWWQLIPLTVIGIIPLVIWLASKGSDQDNQYGSPA